MNKRDIFIFILILVAGIVLYFPLLDNTFLSDDYRSLYRILVEKRVLYKGVFRPLIDVSFYANYLLSGLDPFSYYLLNIIIHCLSAFMVYKVALRFKVFDDSGQFLFAVISGLFFLIFPFHNESVAWLTGRLSSIACLCALLVLYWSSNSGYSWKYLLASVAVFLFALTGYESIILLPFIVLIWNWHTDMPRKQLFGIFCMWCVLTGSYIVLRYVISGEVTSGYGSRMLTIGSLAAYGEKLLKVTGRLFLPPLENPSLMTRLFSAVLLIVTLIQVLIIRRLKNRKPALHRYLSLIIALSISLILPVIFGISTRTSEGDRLLYFPSAFVCIIISFWIVLLVSSGFRWIFIGSVCIYFLFFLLKNNNQWEAASDTAKSIVEVAAKEPEKMKILINIPDEIEGTFVFRQGFNEALRVLNIDTSKVVDVNYLNRRDFLQKRGLIAPEYKDGVIHIYPATSINKRSDTLIVKNMKTGEVAVTDTGAIIIYWDKKVLNRITLYR